MWVSVPIVEYALHITVAWMLAATECWWQQAGTTLYHTFSLAENGDSDALGKVSQGMTEAQLHGQYRHNYSSFSSCSEPLDVIGSASTDWDTESKLLHSFFVQNVQWPSILILRQGILSRSSFLYLKKKFCTNILFWGNLLTCKEKEHTGDLMGIPESQSSSADELTVVNPGARAVPALQRSGKRPLRASLFLRPIPPGEQSAGTMQILDNSHLMIWDLNHLKRLN